MEKGRAVPACHTQLSTTACRHHPAQALLDGQGKAVKGQPLVEGCPPPAGHAACGKMHFFIRRRTRAAASRAPFNKRGGSPAQARV